MPLEHQDTELKEKEKEKENRSEDVSLDLILKLFLLPSSRKVKKRFPDLLIRQKIEDLVLKEPAVSESSMELKRLKEKRLPLLPAL